MKTFLCALLALLPLCVSAAQLISGKDGTAETIVNVNSSGQITTTLGACEDQTNGVCRTENQTSYSGPKTGDAQISDEPGAVSAISCQGTDGTATAGTITLYDSLTETGTKIWEWDVQAVAVTSPTPNPFAGTSTIFGTGLYLGFATTADVKCHVSFR